MKIRYCGNLVLFFDTFIGILLLLIASLSYFMGFPINNDTLSYYFIVLFSILFLIIAIYLLYLLLCRTYIIFTNNEIIKNKKNENSVLIKYENILKAKYYNTFNLLIGDPKGGNLIIEYLDKCNKVAYIYIPISTKQINNLKTKGYLKNIYL